MMFFNQLYIEYLLNSSTSFKKGKDMQIGQAEIITQNEWQGNALLELLYQLVEVIELFLLLRL
jgi:hypothetical protein